MTCTRSFLSALLVSTALLAELAAPKHKREHKASFDTLPSQSLSSELKAERSLPHDAVKPRRETNTLELDSAPPSHFIMTKSFSYPIQHLFIPYIHFELDELPSLHTTSQLSKQKTFRQWTPIYKSYLNQDPNPRHTSPIAFLEKNVTHERQTLIRDVDVTLTKRAEVQDFVIDAKTPFQPVYPTIQKPPAAFRFCFSPIHLQAHTELAYPWVDVKPEASGVRPNLEYLETPIAKSSFSDLPITVRLPKSPITHADCPIYYSMIAFAPSAIKTPSIHLEGAEYPLFIATAPYKAPVQDRPVEFTNPHMQPEKTKPFAMRYEGHYVDIVHTPSSVPSLIIDHHIAHDSARSMLHELGTQRLPPAQIQKPKTTHFATISTGSFTALPTDALLDPSPTPTTQTAKLAQITTREIPPLVLDIIPLTIMLPTLEKSGFTFKDAPVHITATPLDPRHYPAYQRSDINLQALVNMPEMPLSHLVKSNKPLFAPAYSRPRSVEFDDLEWANQEIRVPSLILGAISSKVPTFAITSAPDARNLYRFASYTHAKSKSNLPFQSQLISAIELPTEPLQTKPEHKRIQFAPSAQASAKIDVAACLITNLNPGEFKAIATPKHLIDPLDLSNALITNPDPIVHPASRHGLSAQLQATLIADASYEQQLAKKRLTPDQYIRKYGHYPTYELSQITVSSKTLPLPLHLDPLPDGTPHLWEDPSLVEDISTRFHFAERRHQRRSDRLNRQHRVTATNLARIPTLFELDTTSQSHDFTTTVSWLPKTTDGKYLFSITLKPLENFARIQQNIYFIIDNSTSINKGKATAYKSAIARALPYIHKDDHFNIFIIDDELHAMSATNLNVTATTKAQAREYLEKQKFFHPYKTSNVYAQLTKLSQTLENVPGLHTVFFFTDGASLLDLNKHLTDVHTLITTNKSTFNIYPTCVGNDNHSSFIHMLSTLQRGKVMHSPTMAPFPRKFAGFVKKHQQPIACDLHAIALSSDENAHVKLFTESPNLPAFYANQPLTLYGETDTLSDIHLMIQGRFGDSFVNINKKISFDQNAQTTATAHQEGARFQAASYFLEFLQTKDIEPLSKANALLIRYGSQKLL